MANDPRTVTIAFAGDTTNIDQSFVNVLHATRQFGLEVETVTRKLGHVWEVETDQIDAAGNKIVKKVAAVRMEVKALAKDLDAAQKAQGNFQRLQLLPNSGYPSVGVKGTIEDTAANEARKKAEKLQATLLAYDEKTAEARRIAHHEALVKEAEQDKNFLKAAQLRRQEEELQAERIFVQKMAAIRARLADPKDRLNAGSASMSGTGAIQTYEKEKAQLRQLEKELKNFAEESKLLSQKAKTSALSGSDNALVRMRAQIAQQEVDIEQRKNQKLIDLALQYQRTRDNAVKQGLVATRTSVLEGYSQELKDLQRQKEKLREMEVKATKSAGGFGAGFKDLASRIIEVNLLWNAVNRLNMAVGSAVASIIPLGIQLDSVKASLQATVGGTSATVDVLAALNDEAQRTGLEIGNLRNNFKLFQASTSLAGASLQKTWRMFTDLNTVSAALHLTNEQTNSVFLAMAQIFNKGKVQAEELVRQLGNLLPGAFASFAVANQMTTQKLMEQMEAGRVFAQDTMEKFTSYMATKFSSSFATASQGLNADINRMNTEFTKLGEGLYALVRGPVQNLIKGITSFTKLISDSTGQVTNLDRALSAINVTLTTLAAVGFAKLTQSLYASVTAVKLLEGAMAFIKSPVVWVGTLAAIAASMFEFGEAAKSAAEKSSEFLKVQLELDRIARERKEGKGREIEIRNAVENDKDVKDLLEEISRKEQEISRIKGLIQSGEKGGLGLNSIPTDYLNKLNEEIKKFRELAQLSEKELPLIEKWTTKKEFREQELAFLEKTLEYYRKRLELQKENVTVEKQKQIDLEQQAAIKPIQQSKDLDVVKAQIAEKEFLRDQAVANKNFNEAKRIGKEILELKKQEVAETKKGSEVTEKLVAVEKELFELGKKSRTPEGLNKYEEQQRLDLMAELGRLRQIQRGFNASVDAQALRESEALKQKEKTNTAKQFPLFSREAEAAIEVTKTALKEEETRYKNLEQTAYQFYANTALLRKTALDEEINAHEKRKQLLQDPVEIQTESEKIKQLQQEKQTVLEETTQAYNKDYEQLVSMMNKINTEYLDSVGRYAESGLSKVQEETRNQLKTLETLIASAETPAEGNGFFDTQGEKAAKFNELIDKAKISVDQLKAKVFDQQAEGFFKQYNEKAQFIDKELAIKEIMIRTRQKSGAVTEFGALMERQTALSEFIKQKQTELGTLETQIKEASDKTDAASTANVAKWKQELAEKKALLAEFVAGSNLLADRFETIFSDAFSNSFAAFVSGTQTASEAFQSFGQSVIQTLARMAAQELATQIFSWVKTGVSLFGGVAGAASGVGTSAATSLVDSAGGYPFASIPNYNGNVIPDGTSSFYEQFKNKINFADGGIPAIGSVKQSFLMANGAVGTLRERGPEAILPLQRDGKGKLGVQAVTNNQDSGLKIENIQINVENKKEESGPDLANTIAETLVRRLADEQIQKASRPGNLLNKTTRFG